MSADEDAERRQEEWTALLAIYGEEAVEGAPDALEWRVSLGERCGWLEGHQPVDQRRCPNAAAAPQHRTTRPSATALTLTRTRGTRCGATLHPNPSPSRCTCRSTTRRARRPLP